MRYQFIIEGKLPNLNDYLKAERSRVGGRNGSFNTQGNVMKHQCQDRIIRCIRRDLRGLKINKPVVIHYDFYEENMKRDLDNVMSTAMKFTQDALVKANVLANDGWSCIKGISADFYVDARRPHILVTLEEIDDE